MTVSAVVGFTLSVLVLAAINAPDASWNLALRPGLWIDTTPETTPQCTGFTSLRAQQSHPYITDEIPDCRVASLLTMTCRVPAKGSDNREGGLSQDGPLSLFPLL
jgi:hypothetical protein